MGVQSPWTLKVLPLIEAVIAIWNCGFAPEVRGVNPYMSEVTEGA